MQTEIRYRPSFATLFAQLAPGDKIVAESDAMASMTSNVNIEPKLFGGFFSGLKKKFFAGESLFVNEFTLRNGNEGEVVFTQNTPGDIVSMELKNQAICLQPGAFIAYSGNIKVNTRWAGFRSFLNGEGLFHLVLSGTGTVWFGAYGGIVEKEVQGEFLVDTGHLVAYEPQLDFRLQMAGSGFFSSFASGEGILTRMEGNGKIYIQTRSLSGLASWLNSKL